MSTANGNGEGKLEGPPEGGTPSRPIALGAYDVDAEIAACELRLQKLRRLNRIRRILQAAETNAGKNEVADAALQTILDVVCAQFCVEAAEIMGRARHARIAWARHATAYLLRQFTSGSLMHVGVLLGGRVHGTVLNSIRAVEDRMETEREFAALMKDLLNEAKAVVKPIKAL
jgi:chromosomal replication initiation ATPase DnaA